MSKSKKDTKLRQEILEFVVMGVVSQGGPSMFGINCVYTSRDGRHCHIGFFVPNAPELSSAWAATKEHPIQEAGWWFLQGLQDAHDAPAKQPHFAGEKEETLEDFWRRYKATLKSFCSQWGLRFPGELL